MSLWNLVVNLSFTITAFAPFLLIYLGYKNQKLWSSILLIISVIASIILALLIAAIGMSKGDTIPPEGWIIILIISFIPFYINLAAYGIGRFLHNRRKSS